MKHLRLLLSIALTMVLSHYLNAQEWYEDLVQSKPNSELTLDNYSKAFNDYWEPYNVDKGYYIINGEKKKAGGWKQFKRWEYYMENLVNPITKAFPNQTAMQVYESYTNNKSSQETSKSASWTSMGPTSTPGGYAGIGRINCVAFHPSDLNTYWIGAASGGLWMTNNNGSNWTCLTDNNGVLAISDIIIPTDFATSNTIYIATGDRDAFDNNSIGVLKSTDGGNTWNSTDLTFAISDGKMVNRLLLDPTDNQTIIAATTDGVYKTTNGGTTWNTQLTTESFIDMEYEPGNFNRLYGSNTIGGIFMSSNGGLSWTQSFNNGDVRRIELSVSMDNVNIVYAVASNDENGLYGIYKSTNKGDSFSITYDGSISDQNLLGWVSTADDVGGQAWYDLAIATSHTDANTVLVGGINTWRSTDGGTTWNIVNHWWGDGVQAVHADKHNLTYRNDGTLFEVNDGGIYISPDDGTTWTDKSIGLVISQMYKLGISALDENEVITGLQDNGTKLLDNSTWNDVKGGDGMECLIDYSDNNIQYGTYVNGQITRTIDKWNNRTDIEPSSAGDGAWVTPYIIHPTDPATIYAGYADVWKTTDRGNNWTQISTMNTTNKIRSMAISQSDPNTIYVADQTTIWKTSNGGTNWTEISASLPFTGYFTSLAVKYDDPDVVWVTYSFFSGDRVYESTDGGNNWTNISSGLPNIPVYSIVQNIQNTSEVHLYAGTELGVYFKEGTNNWVEFNDGLPNVKIGELEIFYNTNPSSSKLRAATYGRGLWETPVEYESTDMMYVSSTTEQPTTNAVYSGDIEQAVIQIQLEMQGELNPLDITSFTLNTNGTTDASGDILNAKLWYTGENNTFATNNQFGTTVNTPNGEFTITGNQSLASGTNYFWLTYDINPAASLSNVVDAECSSLTVDGTAFTPTISAPIGNRQIEQDPCDINSLPFTDNFDAYTHGSTPSCWYEIENNSSIYTYEYASYANSDPNSVSLLINDPSDLYLVTPQINEDLSLLRIEFRARYYTKSLILELGTMSDPTDNTTFTPVQDVTISTNTHSLYSIDFDSYTGTDKHIAFRLRSNYNTFENTFEAIFIDDVYIDYIPTCKRPINLNASSITTSSAILSWDDINGASNWIVEVGLAGFTPGTGNQITDNAGETDQNPWTVNGLPPSENYEFYVQADCGGGDLSLWAGPYHFTTGCENFSIPVFENFDNLPHNTMPACWVPNVSGNASSINYANSQTLSYSTGNFQLMYVGADPDTACLISPQLDANIADLAIEFYARWYNNGQLTIDIGTMSNPYNINSFTSAGQLLIQNETYELYDYDFSAYTGTDQHIAIRLSTNSGAQSGYVFLDDILIDFNNTYLCTVESLPWTEDFETTSANQALDLNCWTNFSEAGTQQWFAKSFDSNLYAEVTAYNSGEPSVISWLISPPLNMDNYGFETLNFISKTGYYVHDAMSLWKSDNYDDINPLTATWTPLPATFATGPSGSYGSWVPSGDIDLSSYSGTVHIAFRYEGSDGVNTTTFQLDNINIINDLSDIEVSEVYSMGKLPINFSTPHTVQAYIKNNGINTNTDIDVTMDITGDNPFTDVQTISSLAPGDSILISFAGYSPTIEGLQTCTISVPSDDIEENNSDAYDIETTLNTFNYAEGDTPFAHVGFNGGTGDFVAKFSTTDPAILNQVDVIFNNDGISFKIGVWDDDGIDNAPGTLLYSSDEALTTSGRHTMLINPGVNLLAGDFFVGIMQTSGTNVGFGYQEEQPIRAETFYFTSPTGSTTWNDFAPNNVFRLMIEPKFATPNDVSILSASADNAQINQPVDIEFEVINYGTESQSDIPVYYSVDGGTAIGPVTISGPLSLNSSEIGSFTGTFAYTPPDYGTYDITVFTDLINDEVPANDDYTFTLNLLQPEILISETSFYFGNQEVGGSTPSETYTVNATNLISDVTITAPSGFEISLDNTDFSVNPLIISPVDGTITNQSVYVRFTPLNNIAYDDNITHTATDATQVDLNVLGNGYYPIVNDIEVSEVYSMGKLPINFSTPHTVQAYIKNNGINTNTDIDVTMDITGDNPFTDVQTISSLAPGDSILISFAGYSPTIEGLQTCTISVPSDDIEENNSDAYDIETTLNTFNYAEGDVPFAHVGFNGGTGDFVAKFSTTDPAILNQVDVIFSNDGVSFKIGVWDDDGVDNTPGTLLYSSDEALTTSGRHTMLINPGVNLLAGDFFVGIMQTSGTNVGFGYQEEQPIRAETFYFASPTGSTTWSDFAPYNAFRLMIEPKFATPNDVSVLSASANNAQINQPVDIAFEVINYGTDSQSDIPVYYSVDGSTAMGSVTISGPIDMNNSETGAFTGAFAYTPPDYGTYDITVFTDLINDEVPANDDYTFTLNLLQPEILISETSFNFGNQEVGGSTPSETYIVNATNLISDVTITAPSGFEISLDNTDFSVNPLIISPVGGTITNQSVYVRFTPLNNIAYDDNITHTATDATQVDLNVLGNGYYPTPIASISNTPACGTGTVRVSSNLSGTQTFYLYNHDGTIEIENSGAVTADYYYFTGLADGIYTGKVERLGEISDLSEQTDLVNVPLPTASITGDATICEGETTNLTITLTGSQPWSISYTDGTNTFDVNDITSSPYTITVSEAGNYSVTTLADANCSGTDITGSAIVDVNPLPTASITGDATICEGETTDLTVTLTGSQPWSISYTDGTNTFDVTDITNSPYTIPVSNAGNYSVTTLADANCSGTDITGSAIVDVNALPEIVCPEGFTINNTDPVTLSGATPEGGIYSGIGINDGIFNPSGLENGVYDVIYTYQDLNSGCESDCNFSITLDIEVSIFNQVKEETIIYPNPTNGLVYVEGNNIKNITVTNIEGKTILSIDDVNDNLYKVDMSNYPKEMYLFKVTTKNQVSINKLILN